jgi:hypothetical protein
VTCGATVEAAWPPLLPISATTISATPATTISSSQIGKRCFSERFS